MSKNTNRKTAPKGKMVRRFGVNVFGNTKYDRLLAKKSGANKKNRRPAKQSIYGQQLLEKQKIRFAYGVSEKQLRAAYAKAKNQGGVAGHNMLILLESRLDNVVYRLGLCSTRPQARQLVRHGHFTLNDRKVDIPSALVKPGDVIAVTEKSREMKVLRENAEVASAVSKPGWLSLNGMSGKVERLPERQEIPTIADEQIVVEYYSR
ncbi:MULTISPECIES: 30S ribosomal protein S4 [Dethiosulfovibrio]|jgi:small subunit ribosomal protein S4|uniref:Small ribosomal subunit protein uS4 n=2 Tax=Dethiosulfovibrio TaxID=47054 RepID=A0ABS9ESZ2_9BACT|nr:MULTISPECIES: 30S ribosomal protein S4 [Dethiosulfovibrio]MCF4114416.1 30S ribosomal protein S4 [Dethiosulfovibrio russensis]MCF4142923.1 30S ribosomal protein S4 [Dethiosulfovibrio marinus]MCF4145020.1 30S ribosomal protein S4 [Dethiosulfovibrio acidaminovorans]